MRICQSFVLHQALAIRSLTKLPHTLRKRTPTSKVSIVGLYRMKQFYETYKDDEFVTPLVTQISWTNHLLIMSGSKTADERHFYMALCAKEHYSKRELERQIGTSYYERSMISAKKPMPESVSHDVRESILDTYVLEFLDLPEQFSEKNLRKAIIENLKQFILEHGTPHR